MFAVIYLAIGALAGMVVTSPVNGTVLIFFVWITDVMFGPVFGSPARPADRVFPTHFLTMWMTGLPSHHAGRVGDLGWALIWALGTAIAAWAVLAAVFIDLATALAPGSLVRLTVDENGREVTEAVSLAFGAGVHPAFMAPIAIASLATLAGMFIILDSRDAHQRLVLAGQRRGPLLAGRLTLIALAALIVTGVSLTVAATVLTALAWLAGAAMAAALLFSRNMRTARRPGRAAADTPAVPVSEVCQVW